jgi:hypothetical protein
VAAVRKGFWLRFQTFHSNWKLNSINI